MASLSNMTHKYKYCNMKNKKWPKFN